MQVLPGVHRIPHIRGANVYLLEDEDQLTLIDSGWPGNAATIVSYIRALGGQPESLKRILITHGHPDHTGSTRPLMEITGAEALAHPADTEPDDTGIAHIRHSGMMFVTLPALWHIPVNSFLTDGSWLPIMDGLQVLHTPGHTPGSVCFYLERHDALFTGDLVTQRGNYLSRSLPFPETDLDVLQRSLERVSGMSFDVACLSHGGVIRPFASEAIRNATRWYGRSPQWLKWLQGLPALGRLGVETGYKYR